MAIDFSKIRRNVSGEKIIGPAEKPKTPKINFSKIRKSFTTLRESDQKREAVDVRKRLSKVDTTVKGITSPTIRKNIGIGTERTPFGFDVSKATLKDTEPVFREKEKPTLIESFKRAPGELAVESGKTILNTLDFVTRAGLQTVSAAGGVVSPAVVSAAKALGDKDLKDTSYDDIFQQSIDQFEKRSIDIGAPTESFRARVTGTPEKQNRLLMDEAEAIAKKAVQREQSGDIKGFLKESAKLAGIGFMRDWANPFYLFSIKGTTKGSFKRTPKEKVIWTKEINPVKKDFLLGKKAKATPKRTVIELKNNPSKIVEVSGKGKVKVQNPPKIRIYAERTKNGIIKIKATNSGGPILDKAIFRNISEAKGAEAGLIKPKLDFTSIRADLGVKSTVKGVEQVTKAIKPITKVKPIVKEVAKPFHVKPQVVKKIELTEKFDINKPETKEFKKAEHEAQILTELQGAEKGERILIRDEEGSVTGTVAKKSTFPGFIPEGLRSKKLIDTVLEHINKGTLPKKANEVRLYNIVEDEIASFKRDLPAIDKEINVAEIDFGSPGDEAKIDKEIKIIQNKLKKDAKQKQQPTISKKQIKETKTTEGEVQEKSLTEEAKKFKTAEEFTKNKINAFHQTNNKFDTFKPDDIAFFTTRKFTAPINGKNTIEANVNFKKTFKLEKRLPEDKLRAMIPDLKKKGFDSMEVKGRGGKILVSFEPAKTVKTKKELTDIFNKAKKEIVKKPIKKVTKEKTAFDVKPKKVEPAFAKKKEPVKPIEKPKEIVKKPKIEIKEKPTVKKVVREQLPISSKEGKLKVSKLEARAKGVLKGADQETIDKLGLSTFNQVNNKVNVRKASQYVSQNPEEALEVLKGNVQAPKGILRNSIYVAMDALSLDDSGLALKLASLQSTRLGQEISVLQEMNEFSTVKNIRNFIDIKEKTVGKRTGKKVAEVKKAEIKNVKKQIKKIEPKKDDWSSFIDSIEC